MNKALIIAAHPDDDILGCGGFISNQISNINFKVVFIGEGSSCRFENPNSTNAKQEIEKRNKMGIDSLNFLGVKEYEFYNLPCGRFDQIPQIEINKIIETEIKKFQPDTIFTHSKCDSNKDHHKVFDATIIATRPESQVKRVLSYEVLSSTEWGFSRIFQPNIFFPLNKIDLKNKWESLKMYETEIKEFPFPRSEKGIFTLAQYRGMQSGNEYAEAFHLVREFA